MELLSKLYVELLNRGFLVLRQAVDANDLEWVRAEMKLLHNVPSLIDEKNENRHEYFWSSEVVDYQEWVANCGREVPKSRMKIYYEPLWLEIERLLNSRQLNLLDTNSSPVLIIPETAAPTNPSSTSTPD